MAACKKRDKELYKIISCGNDNTTEYNIHTQYSFTGVQLYRLR